MFSNDKKKYYNEDLFDQEDFDDLKEELDVEKSSRQKAIDNKPSTESVMENSDEQKIYNYFKEKLSFVKQTIHTKISVYEQLANKLNDIKNYIAESKYASDNFTQDITTWKESSKHKLEAANKYLVVCKNDLTNFKIDNNILREASYPDSVIFHVSIILFIVMTETFLNAYFFAKGNEFGLLGGASQALIISIINMIFAYFVGNYLVRNLYLKTKKKHREISLALIVILMIIVFTFNLLVGHLRIQLGLNPDDAYHRAIVSFIESPFNLSDFDSVILVGIGLLVFTLGSLDFFKMDDEYPKYGKLTRNYNSAFDAYTDIKENILDDLNTMSVSKIKNLEKIHETSKLRLKEIQEIPIFRQKLQVQYNEHYNYLNNTYRALIGLYRNTNKDARTDEAPKYFDNFKELDPEYHINCVDKNLKKNIAQVENDMLEFPHIIAKQKSLINNIVEDTLSSLKEYMILESTNAKKE